MGAMGIVEGVGISHGERGSSSRGGYCCLGEKETLCDRAAGVDKHESDRRDYKDTDTGNTPHL